MCALVKIYYNCLILKWCKSSQNSSLTPGCQSLRCFARFVVLLFICSADSEGRGGVQAPAVCHVEEVKIAPLLSYCYKLVSYPLTIFNINCVWVSNFLKILLCTYASSKFNKFLHICRSFPLLLSITIIIIITIIIHPHCWND